MKTARLMIVTIVLAFARSVFGQTETQGATAQTLFGNGSYSFDGNTLIMTGDDRRRTTAQFRLEQESKDFGRSWTDSMCLLGPGSSGEVCYKRDR
jgi:hypothetical protein